MLFETIKKIALALLDYVEWPRPMPPTRPIYLPCFRLLAPLALGRRASGALMLILLWMRGTTKRTHRVSTVVRKLCSDSMYLFSEFEYPTWYCWGSPYFFSISVVVGVR
jgi:hypothetical protein